MTVPFMDAYVRLLIQTCHKRKVSAMGGSEPSTILALAQGGRHALTSKPD